MENDLEYHQQRENSVSDWHVVADLQFKKIWKLVCFIAKCKNGGTHKLVPPF